MRIKYLLLFLLAFVFLGGTVSFADRIVPITDLPEVFITKQNEIPMEYLEYVYYPFSIAPNTRVYKNGQVFGPTRSPLKDGDVVSFTNTNGDLVKFTAVGDVGTIVVRGPGDIVPFEFANGNIKITVNDKSQFKGFATFADIDNGDNIVIKKSDLYKIAAPENSAMRVRISDDGEWYTFLGAGGAVGRDDPKYFLTLFFDNFNAEQGIRVNGSTVDFTNRVTWQKPQFGSLIERYVDKETGALLTEEVIMTGNIGSGYVGKVKNFNDYDLVDQPEKLEGVYTSTNPVVFEYKYVRKEGQVVVKYQAEIDGIIQKLGEDVVLIGKVGTDFVTELKTFDGYEYTGEIKRGSFIEGEQEVIYVYTLTKPINLSPITDIETRRGKQLTLDVVATNGPVVDVNVSGLPTGLSYDPVSRLISGKTNEPVGKYLVTVVANGRYGDRKEVQFTITVKAKSRSQDPTPSPSEPEKKPEPKPQENLEENKPVPVVEDQVFNPTVENGKCYTRRELKSILDSTKISTSEEFKKALSFMWSYEMTMYDSVDGYDPYRNLSREEAAKMFSNFAMNVLCRKPDKNLKINYSDTENADPTLKPYIELAYQLGVMKGSGKGDGEFRPFDYISKAEVNAVLIRMILKSYLDESGALWYWNYNKVSDNLKITEQWPGNASLPRNDVALMLFRAYKHQEFEWREIGYFSFVLKLRDLFVK